MRATRIRRARLAADQPSHRGDDRFAQRRLRDALQQVIAGQPAPQPDAPWYDNTREIPRAPIVCEKERAMLAAAIQQGRTTPQQILSYYLVRIADTMAQFDVPVPVSDVCYVRLMAEQAEALEAQARARGLGTESADETAARETEEAIVLSQLYVAGVRERLNAGAR